MKPRPQRRDSGNQARTQAVQQRRRSGASGPHAAGAKRQRDRRSAKQAAIRYAVEAG